ncbi:MULTISPECIES: extracellular solute-binding protein [unclassified Breznakia]|uniref:extracellular solute-binding protein n=1 Tax=unclassified Breznakia TaxID=2623764 RepID=UPI00247323B9|nr:MULTISPECIES: extracellular solute-binding protein [unclassified Breznakia]MDH6366275.1 iron(III) transport system substrate-binding protein [Breznakia sp. PH1-1]MDH6403368.1 iron(III) transport system substrate-binding protein [Breznakia sp. PF1-11]MDH6411077.1 iron(III) transport system substrate-binding protein [Breznakia sp. PFB1-11]MDH6413441.1 iron(III) transport system substrate-binding protein [Breznakia sp. PFB1-14]MDH6416770.1 iron(III) transport system substrate-binding protein [
MSKLNKIIVVIILLACTLSGCAKKESSKVIIYSNADEEAQEVIKQVLDENGFENKYILQAYGTNELGGKLLGEGIDVEADIVTMSSYYIDSAQSENKMFVNLDESISPLEQTPKYRTPLLAIEGSLIINTKELEEANLPVPTSIKDLAKPVYKDHISIVDMAGSSTGWLLVQTLIDTYGEKEAEDLLVKIMRNAGPHLESSGSGPLKKVRAGEVAIGFGLRHQAVADKKEGLPIDFIDPKEGNYALTESIAVVKRSDKKTKLAKEMAKCIVEKGRTKLIENYPIPVYENEKADSEKVSKQTKQYTKPLTIDLLQKHLDLSEKCRIEARE